MKYSHGHDGTIVNGVSRMGHMHRGKSALWKDEHMSDVFLNKAVNFVEENKEQPFFFYYVFHQPHVPRIPAPRFKGATTLGARGDIIIEMDWCVGEMINKLEQLGIEENTIVIFSSDNGPVLDDGYMDQAEELQGSHKAAGPKMNENTNTELGNAHEPQLYDLSLDIGQIRNIAVEHGEIVNRLSSRLQDILKSEKTR